MRFLVLITVLLLGLGTGARAQDRFWVQIEARPSLTQAEDRIRAWTNTLPDVNGYALRSGWYAVALGPYARDDAARRLNTLLLSGQIPPDSFISDGGNFRSQFWPVGAALGSAQTLALVPAPIQPETEVVQTPAAPAPADETPAEARAAEAALLPEDRRLVQTALQFEGFYTSVIDGAFGPGTRNAMASWQQARGYEPTGILTTRQRNELVSGYTGFMASLGLAPVYDQRAGIRVEAPLGLVAFDRYDPPFAYFEPLNDSGVRFLLISQTGDRATLAGLYDLLQTLSIVPLEGPRERREREFTITGQNASIVTEVYAREADGQIKGYILSWPTGDERRRQIALTAIRSSFEAIPDSVLPDTVGDGANQSVDLLSGLEIRKPKRARTGFYVSPDGAVVTTADAVEGCSRITLDGRYDATVSTTGETLALLRPSTRLSPPDVARLDVRAPRLSSEIAVAGYAYDGILNAPVMTFGTFADTKGLQGEPDVSRLALDVTASDAGAPVLDTEGAVVGLLLPRETGTRVLPEDVAFAANGSALVDFLAGQGLSPYAADESGPSLSPEDLTTRGLNIAVLVNCWD